MQPAVVRHVRVCCRRIAAAASESEPRHNSTTFDMRLYMSVRFQILSILSLFKVRKHVGE